MDRTKNQLSLKSKQQLSIVVLGMFCALLVGHHFFLFTGHQGFDDIGYSRLANALLEGRYDWTDHYSYRIIPISATALSYALFGISDHTSAIPTLIVSFAILYYFYKFLKDKPLSLMLAIVIYFSMQWNLYYSDKLMPDLYVSLFTLIAWYHYDRYQTTSKDYHPIAMSIALIAAFLSKGTIILAVPVFLFLFASDLSQRRYRFWKIATPSILILGTIYFAWIYVMTGSALSRFKAISANSYLNDCSYDQLGWDHLFDRLTNGFYHFLTSEMLIVPALFVLVGILLLVTNRIERSSIWKEVILGLTCLLSINFMTISITSYSPVCLDPRHILLLTPLLAITGARVVQKWAIKEQSNLPMMVAIIAVLLTYYSQVRPFESRIKLDYPSIKEDLRILGTDPQPTANLYGTQMLINITDYYNGFDSICMSYIKNIEQLDQAPKNEPVYLIRNFYTEFLGKLSEREILEMVSNAGYSVAKKPLDLPQYRKCRIYLVTPIENK